MSATDQQLRTLLAYLGTAMIATGQTVGEVEDELTEVSARLGRPDVQIAGSPTGITLNLASGEPATFESVNAPLRLDQAVEVRAIRHLLLDGSLSVVEATGRLLALRSRPRRYPAWAADVGLVVASAGICLILQPGAANVLFATLAGIAVAGLLRLAARFTLIATLVPALAAFIIGCGLFAAADAGLLEGPLRTALASLAVLLPGALIVTAMSELAAGDMMAGSARLIFGIVQLMLFTLGLVAASQLLQIGPEQLANIRVQGLGWWTAPAGLIIISVGITLMESPPLRLLPWIVAVLAIALTAQTLGQQVSAPLGSFLGALAASLGAYLVEAIRPSLPRLVVFLPAFWLLVPGSLGLLSTTQLAVERSPSISSAVQVAAVISALALGLLVGAAVAQSVRGALSRIARRRSEEE
jgi:uncharacterized membrane protein YjjP (DUF1212 family)